MFRNWQKCVVFQGLRLQMSNVENHAQRKRLKKLHMDLGAVLKIC